MPGKDCCAREQAGYHPNSDRIRGAAYCIPFQHGQETSWLVNPYIDLRTWSIVYDSVNDCKDA